MDKRICLTFDLEEIINDVLVTCNQISKSVREESMEDLKVSVLDPNSPETRTIILRAVTEAWGKVKQLCQRYLRQGRTVDNNHLERLISKVTHVKEQATDASGRHLLFHCTMAGVPHDVYMGNDMDEWIDVITKEQVAPDDIPEPIIIKTHKVDDVEYEQVVLELFIPDFNVAVTDTLKSNIHSFMCGYVLSRFLRDQLPDKAAEYKAQAEGENRTQIIRNLNARERFNFRKPAWI